MSFGSKPFAEKHFYKILILILLLGGVLRLVGFDWGLPKEKFHLSLEEDEKYYLMTVKDMDFARLDFDPNFYIHGPLVAYLWEATLSVARIMGLADHNLDEEYLAKNPAKYRKAMLIGRVQALFFGMAFILLIALVFRRGFGYDSALLAAAFVAVAWDPVHHSGVVRHDQPTGFFIMLMAARGYEILSRGRRRDYIVMALLMALATATVYPAGVLLGGCLFIAAHLGRLKSDEGFSLKNIFDRNFGWFAFCALVIFFLLVPFPIIRFKEFLDFKSILNSGWEKDIWHVSRLSRGINGAWYLLVIVLPLSVGFGLALFGYLALLFGWIKKRKEWLILLIAPTAHLVSLIIITQKYTRHSLFIVGPFFILTARFLLYEGRELLEKQIGRIARPLSLALVFVILLVSLGQTVSILILQAQRDIPMEVSNWFCENIPKGAVIATTVSPEVMLIPPLDKRHYPDLKDKYILRENIGRNKKRLRKSDAEYLVDPYYVLFGMHNKYLLEEEYEKERKYLDWLSSGKEFKLIKTFENDLGWFEKVFVYNYLPIDLYRINSKVLVFKRAKH